MAATGPKPQAAYKRKRAPVSEDEDYEDEDKPSTQSSEQESEGSDDERPAKPSRGGSAGCVLRWVFFCPWHGTDKGGARWQADHADVRVCI